MTCAGYRWVWPLTYGLSLFLCAGVAAVAEDTSTAVGETSAKVVYPLSIEGPEPRDIDPPAAEEIRASIGRGVDFLLETQLEQGCWGRTANSKYYRIWAPVPGAHDAFTRQPLR